MIRDVVNSCYTPRTFEFEILGKRVKLGPTQFAAITGLPFHSNLAEIPTTSAIHKKIFKGKETILFRDISQEFIKECEKTAGKSQESLKLALLVVLYGSLMANVCGKKVELKYLHLADDLEKFYPWGTVAYEYLAEKTHTTQKLIDKRVKAEEEVHLIGCGFTYAIQVLTYEVHSKIAVACATLKDGFGESFPKMLRWSSTNQVICYKDIVGYFESTAHRDSVVRPPMIPILSF